MFQSKATVRGAFVWIVLSTSLLSGCAFLPSGDSATDLDAWNRSNADFIVRVGPDDSSECFVLAAGSFGRLFHQLGGFATGVPPIRLYSSAAVFTKSLVTSMDSGLFVINEGGTIQEVPLRRKYSPPGSGLLVYDMPQFPELDGQLVPQSLPPTNAVCQPSRSARPTA